MHSTTAIEAETLYYIDLNRTWWQPGAFRSIYIFHNGTYPNVGVCLSKMKCDNERNQAVPDFLLYRRSARSLALSAYASITISLDRILQHVIVSNSRIRCGHIVFLDFVVIWNLKHKAAVDAPKFMTNASQAYDKNDERAEGYDPVKC